MLDTHILDIPVQSALGLIMLSNMRGFGRVAVEKIVHNFESIGALITADDDDLKILNVKQRENVRDTKFIIDAHKIAQEQMDTAADLGAEVISLYDDQYPERLKAISDAPFVLYVAGDLSVLDTAVAFVGTREPTEFGSAVARGISLATAADGWCIVSGLARGVDAICHNAAIDIKGTTCAVLASGLDRYTSDAAMNLAQRIHDSGGLLITEQPFGMEANRGSYIARDRLITGLSLATFFIQGESHSGSMHSVRYAIAQKKPVYVPNIPEKFLNEVINETARNLGIMSVGQVASKFDWTGRVMEVIKENPDAPAANKIMSRDEYPRLFDDFRKLNSPVVTANPDMSIAATF